MSAYDRKSVMKLSYSSYPKRSDRLKHIASKCIATDKHLDTEIVITNGHLNIP